MIRRSKKLTAAAAVSSPPSCSSGINDGKKTKNSSNNITLAFASECHASDDNHTHGSSGKSRLHQRYARLRRLFSPLYRQATKSTAKMSSKKDRKHLTKSIATTRCFIVMTILLISYQLDAYIREYQGPFDHVSTTILKPYYGMSCPSFSHYMDDMASSSNGKENGSGITSWDCNAILGKQTTNTNNDGSVEGETAQSTTTFPRIFMIGARDETKDTFQSWQSQLQLNDDTAMSSHVDADRYIVSSSQPYLKRINTLEVSNQFATSGGALRESSSLRLASSTNTTTHQSKTSNQPKQFLCRKIKWEQRLFYVYQHIFNDLLITYPHDDGFVIIEDDATLLNPTALAKEVCNVHHQKIQFYSLYKSPLQHRWRWWRIMSTKQQPPPPSCIYQHGTVAFYIRRQLMQQIVNEHRRSFFCRFPIDMYISKYGPWYATRNEVVGHLGLSRIGSA